MIKIPRINQKNDISEEQEPLTIDQGTYKKGRFRSEINKIKEKFFKVCPKSGRIVGLKPVDLQAPWLFPFIGFAALVWVLIRVVPKPSRARYPCQRVAIPLATSFVLWLLGPLATGLTLYKLRQWIVKKQFANIAVTFLILLLLVGGSYNRGISDAIAAYTPHPANTPIGTAQGLAPGRVVWAHNPDVTDWAGPGSGEYWYQHVDQSVATDMLSWALRGYAEEETDAAAWEAIFSHFNGGTDYQPGEKILIKINLVTVGASGNYADPNYDPIYTSSVTKDSTANSPQMLLALLNQLVNEVGVAQSDITIGDPTGFFVNFLYTPLHDVFPDVHYEDNRGTLERSKAVFSDPCVEFSWSTDDAAGKMQDCVVQSYYEADYLINFALLKSHERAGITVAAKNHYGSMLRLPNSGGYYDLHESLPTGGSNSDFHYMGNYRTLVDLMGSDHIGGKTVLYLVDAIYGGNNWFSMPSKWSLTPFNGDWPSSLLMSMDPVAIDSVAFDFLSQQWPEHVLQYEGVQDYLHEAALADDPPSDTCYDPEDDGTCMTSLGVHEHWNNPTDKQYSRNLGTGEGIELLYFNTDPTGTDFTLTITVDPPEGGSTSPAAGAHVYASGSSVIVTAVAEQGYEFDHWSGACSGSDGCSVEMNANKSVTAHFVEMCYPLTLSHSGEGSDPVASPGNSAGCSLGEYTAKQEITLSGAVPASGWQISGWDVTLNNDSTANTNSLVMPAGAHTASVIYTEIPPACYVLT